MALTEAENLYNLALGHIGEYEVEEGKTSTKEYKLCARFYPEARKITLRSHLWNEAIKRAIVPEEAYGPIFEFTKQYARPSDALKVISIGEDGYELKLWETEGNYIVTDLGETPQIWTSGEKYTIGEYVTLDSITYECLVSNTAATASSPDIDAVTWESKLADLSVIYLRYIWDNTDPSTYSADLKNAMAIQLAILVSTGLHNDIKTKTNLIQEFEQLTMPKARSVDAQEGKPRQYYYSSWLRSRSGV